ncbi:MAG: ABC-type transport auxiliary lipoprotein family protein [Pseudoxanthomonas suwonensis]|nr:ABC-type transport auxiliary lipoprotein family protein [Pseudoxanthomonas suwonensis]
MNTRLLRQPLTGVTVLAALLSGCSLLGASRGESPTIYAPRPQLQAAADWPQVDWQLGIARPEASRMIDSLRIAVRPSADEIQVYSGANWARPPSDQLVDALLQVLGDSGRISAASRQGSGLANDYRLLLDLRHYEADYAGQATPSVVIEVNAQLMRVHDQRVAGARTFRQQLPVGASDIPNVVATFERALANVTTDIAGWALHAGQADRVRHPLPPRR